MQTFTVDATKIEHNNYRVSCGFKLRPCIEKFHPSLGLKKSPRTLAMPNFVLNLLHKTPKKKS